MSMNTIREVTEITGITVNALRYYDSKGLLRVIGIPVENIAHVLKKADRMFEKVCR